MGTLMQLLLEALRANVREGRNSPEPDLIPDEMSGFVLENVQVATMPYIESEDEDDEPNPLLRLFPSRERPPRERLWVAPHKVSDKYDDSDYAEEDEEGSHAGHSDHSKKHDGKPSRVATRPIRLEKEPRSCFARLLFSRCWTGKDQAAGWKIKRKCPHGHKASLSCPCGDIGPCKKVKQNACPVDKLASGNKNDKKNTKSTNASGSKQSGKKGTDAKNHKGCCPKGPSLRKSADKIKGGGGKLCQKIFPCFKEHKHTDCCCRCKDNPALKKSEENGSHHKSKSDKSGKHKSPGPSGSGSPSDYTDDESGYYDDQSEYQAYNIRSVSDLSRPRERNNHPSRKRDSVKESKQKHSPTKYNAKTKETKVYPSWADSVKAPKSTTSFQIMLHPDISNDQIVEPEVVSHQILKTLSTVHGPVKVEQKIVVQGTQNSVVIVTHGEGCQCNLCNMLKGKLHPKDLVEGLSPQVVRISTDNGYNTLINHSDGCKCELCRVLDPVVIKNEDNPPESENEKLVLAACSTTEDNGGEKKFDTRDQIPDDRGRATSPVSAVDNRKNGCIVANPLCRKSKNGKKKSRRCRCTKCRQRRRIEKLKLRLKKEMGSEEYHRIVREVTRPHLHEDEQEKPKRREPSDASEDVGYVKARRTKRMVSFSDDPDPREHETLGELRYKESGRKTKCKLCELTNQQARAVIRQKLETSQRHGGEHNSTVYSITTSSRDSPCDFHMFEGLPSKKISEGRFKSKSKSISEKRTRSFVQEEQNCFPPKRSRRPSYEKKHGAKASEPQDTFDDDDTTISHLHHGSGCSGKCRAEGAREDATSGTPGIFFQEGAFPQKFVYWAPGSRSNVATAYSSESYYVPDQEEFPVINGDCEDSAPSSGPPMHRVHVPVWFRMLPERKSS